jgi:hypothetical protein
MDGYMDLMDGKMHLIFLLKFAILFSKKLTLLN